MTIHVACIQCQKQYSVGEEFAGRAVRCKNCGSTFVVQSPATKPVASDLDLDLKDVLGNVSPTPSGAASYANLGPYQSATGSSQRAGNAAASSSC